MAIFSFICLCIGTLGSLVYLIEVSYRLLDSSKNKTPHQILIPPDMIHCSDIAAVRKRMQQLTFSTLLPITMEFYLMFFGAMGASMALWDILTYPGEGALNFSRWVNALLIAILTFALLTFVLTRFISRIGQISRIIFTGWQVWAIVFATSLLSAIYIFIMYAIALPLSHL